MEPVWRRRGGGRKHPLTVDRRAAVATILLLAALAGCNTAKRFGPGALPLRAASANDFAVEVEFASPLARASAGEASRFTVLEEGNPAAPVAIYSAELADTIFGRVVLLLLSGGPLNDGARYVVRASGVRDVFGVVQPDAEAEFRAGLRYGADLAPLLAEHCNDCHGPTRADGAYRTDALTSLLGTGTDSIPNLIAGNPNCALVHRTRPIRSMYDKGMLSPLDADIIRNWVVSYQARP